MSWGGRSLSWLTGWHHPHQCTSRLAPLAGCRSFSRAGICDFVCTPGNPGALITNRQGTLMNPVWLQPWQEGGAAARTLLPDKTVKLSLTNRDIVTKWLDSYTLWRYNEPYDLPPTSPLGQQQHAFGKRCFIVEALRLLWTINKLVSKSCL